MQFIENATEDLFGFTNQLQGVSNLPKADKRFIDTRKIVRDFAGRIS